MNQIEYLDVEDLLILATGILGDPPPVRDYGLLESAVARPRASVFGEDAYPDIWTKAAALLQSLVKSDPLVDGNKRLGWLATAVFLDLNGFDAAAIPPGHVYDFVIALAAGTADVPEIAEGLRQLTESSG